MVKSIFFTLFLLFGIVANGLTTVNSVAKSILTEKLQNKKIGVLLVSHGSRSERWRDMLMAVEPQVKKRILGKNNVVGIKSAFMEYTEPSIATRLKEFDKDGFTDVIIIPLFLTVSSHSFDDIPTIVGLKNDKASREVLKIEKIERYLPKARVQIGPELNFAAMLKKNIIRRVKALSRTPKNEGVVFVAYGSKAYNTEWVELLDNLGKAVKDKLGISYSTHSWCGHIAHYKTAPTKLAIKNVLTQKNRALVVPVLVAFDEMFQEQIIGAAVKSFNNDKNVVYKPDAILPDQNIFNWIVSTSNRIASRILVGK